MLGAQNRKGPARGPFLFLAERVAAATLFHPVA